MAFIWSFQVRLHIVLYGNRWLSEERNLSDDRPASTDQSESSTGSHILIFGLENYVINTFFSASTKLGSQGSQCYDDKLVQIRIKSID